MNLKWQNAAQRRCLFWVDLFLPPTSNIITTLYEIVFSTIFETTLGYFSVWKKVVFFYLETERFLPVIRDKFRKLSGIEGFRYRREFKQFCSLLRRCRERKEKSAIDKFFFGIDWAIMVTMQPSFTTIKTATACEQSLHLRDIEKSHVPVASERRGGSKVRERKWELFVSSAPRSLNAHSRVRLPLEMERLRVRYSMSQFALGILRKIRAIYVQSNVHFSSTSRFSPISTNP